MTESKIKQLSSSLGILKKLVVDFSKVYKALQACPKHRRGTKDIKLAQKMKLGKNECSNKVQ